MALFDSVLKDMGNGLAGIGESFLNGAGDVWEAAGSLVTDYIAQNPAGGGVGGWGMVTSLYASFQGIAVSLTILFFFMGWCRESIDIHRDFTLDNIIRFLIRFFLTVQAVLLGLDFIKEFMGLVAALTQGIAAPLIRVSADGSFTGLLEELDGGECFAAGIIFFLGGLVGWAVVVVCSFKIILAVLSRFFRLFVIIPFGPVAISTFAGGMGLSHTGAAWLKTFFGYVLEVVVIAMALGLSSKMFGDMHFFGPLEGGLSTPVQAMLSICDAIAPIVACTACISGAESVIRKCLGLNT